MKLRSKILGGVGASIVLLVLAGIVFVRANPLIFNESFFEHAHCIAQADGALTQYALEHEGQFPFDTNGYGDALLKLVPYCGGASVLTGPSYDERPFVEALKTHTHLADKNCGRVYIQGLTTSNDPAIVILYDMVATPGGDHCHFLNRFQAPLCREVLLVGGHRCVRESDWPGYSSNQVELLVKAGFTRERAEACYKSEPR